MVEGQLRPNEVTDPGVLAAMRRLPRERFVPEAWQGLAYMDEEIEVLRPRDGAARVLLSPMVQAQLIQLAEVLPHDTVLDLGCATGYSTAILARLAARVVGVEPEPALARTAKANLEAVGAANAEIIAGSLIDPQVVKGPDCGPYDVILLEGSVPEVPEHLLAQLKEGGRLVAVLTRAPNMRQGKAYLFVRVDGDTRGVPQFDAGASPLPGFAPAPAFSF